MKIRIGDLVYRRQHRAFDTPHDYEIWLVISDGIQKVGCFGHVVRIQNIHKGHRLQCGKHMLIKIETEVV